MGAPALERFGKGGKERLVQVTRESALGQQVAGEPAAAARLRSLPPPLVLLLPTVIVLFVLTIYPTVYSFTLSLNEWNMSNRLATWTFVGLGNYANILRDSRFWNAAQVTATFIFGTVTVQLLLGMGIALLLQRQVVARGLLRTALLLPMMTTPVWSASSGASCTTRPRASSTTCSARLACRHRTGSAAWRPASSR